MKFKILPPAGTRAELDRARGALPLVPKPESDCVARLLEELDLQSRDEARTWLTFLRALGLAAEGPTGFRRTREDPTTDELARRFHERIYGAETALAVLQDAEGPLGVETVYREIEVPKWERDRHTDPDEVWRERVEHVLGWLAALGLAERADGEYRAA